MISALIREYHLDKFFTLTLDRSMPVEKAWEMIPGIWHKFLSVVKRKYPTWKFVAVLESHKDGYPHIHGFTNQWMSQAEYSAHWVACGGGKIAWVEKIQADGHIGEYVSKQLGRYVGKENLVRGKQLRGKGQRTLWRSVGLKAKFELEEGSGEWVLCKEISFDSEGNPLYTVEEYYGEFRVSHKGVNSNA